jgi:N-acetylmuramoyl-L-alanine amidase
MNKVNQSKQSLLQTRSSCFFTYFYPMFRIKIKSILYMFTGLMIPAAVFSQNSPGREMKVIVQQRIYRYLDKDRRLGEFYLLSEEGMSVYASAADKNAGKAEFYIPWNRLSQFYELLEHSDPVRELLEIQKQPGSWNLKPGEKKTNLPTLAQPLKGIRIAVDPGHTAGSIASGKVEQKFLEIPRDSLHHVPADVQLVEGHLTLSTSLLLRKKLEAAGATVMLTHGSPDGTAFGKSFAAWKKEDLGRVLDSLVACKFFSHQQKIAYKTRSDDRKLFREVFRDLELQKRAELIHAFHPDITIIIHFNVDEKNIGWKTLADKDFVMTFIGGDMLPHDLSKRNSRFAFLRMALTDDLDKSEKLSAEVVNSFSAVLGVPIASKNDAKYLHDNCIATNSKGVYCRNLILTRIIGGPLVYGETLYQDNRKEAYALQQEDGEIEGIKTSQRTRDIADAYYLGILAYFGHK